MRASLLILLAVSGQAGAEIYKCVEEGGRVTYSNVATKNCTRLNVGPVAAPPAARPAAPAPRSVSPAEFPRIDSNTQRSRDDDRRRILDQELANEQSALTAARKAVAEQEGLVLPEERNVGGRGINAAKIDQRLQPLRDKVALHERNIEALRKEIANLR